MRAAFERLAASVLGRLGQEAMLVRASGPSVPIRVNIERGVEVMGQFNDAVMLRDVATLDARADPKVGDQVQTPQGRFALDGLLQNNGYTLRFTVQPLP